MSETVTTTVESSEPLMAVPGADPKALHECVFGEQITDGGAVFVGPCIQCAAPYLGKGWVGNQEGTSVARADLYGAGEAEGAVDTAPDVDPAAAGAEDLARAVDNIPPDPEAKEPETEAPAGEEAQEQRESAPAPSPEQTAFAHASPSTPVSVRLGQREMAERGLSLAELISRRDTLVAKKAQVAKSFNAQIQDLDEQISQGAQGIREGHEELRQGDLFFDQVEAAKGLAEVAKHVGEDGDDEADGAVALDANTELAGQAAAVQAEAEAADTFVCAMCDEEGRESDEATFAKSESAFVDSEGRRICPEHYAELMRAAQAPVPGFDFDESEPPPTAISSAKAIAAPEDAAEEVKAATRGRGKRGRRGGEASA